MELSASRLEASSRVQEHPSDGSAGERRRRARQRNQDSSLELEEDELLTDEEQPESHRLDDMA